MNTFDAVKTSNKKTPVKQTLRLILCAFLIFTVLSLAFGRLYYIQCSTHGCQLGILKIEVEAQRLGITVE